MLYNKILELQQFSINPSDVLEDQFDPQTSDYIERRKLLKEMKGAQNNIIPITASNWETSLTKRV